MTDQPSTSTTLLYMKEEIRKFLKKSFKSLDMGRTSGRSLRPRRGDENSNDGSSSSNGSNCGKKRKSEVEVTPKTKKRRGPPPAPVAEVRKTRKSRLDTPPSTPKPTPKGRKKKSKKNNRFEVEDDPPGDPDYESPEEEPPWLQDSFIFFQILNFTSLWVFFLRFYTFCIKNLNLLQADDEVEEAEGDQSIDMESGDEDQVIEHNFLYIIYNICLLFMA